MEQILGQHSKSKPSRFSMSFCDNGCPRELISRKESRVCGVSVDGPSSKIDEGTDHRVIDKGASPNHQRKR
jgi:hypothetical protein